MKTVDEWKALIERYGVHPVFGGSGEFDAWIEQNPDELAQFLVVCEAQGVKSFLEIGTGWKGGLSRFLGAETEWDVATFDVQDYGHNFANVFYFRESRARFFEGVRNDGGAYDVVLIDADHSYEGIKADHEAFGQLAEKIIAFHDIAGLRDCEGVKQYWDEIAWEIKVLAKSDLKTTTTADLRPGYHEIIADGEQRGGIGYIALAETYPELVKAVTTTTAKVNAELAAKKPTPRKRTPAKKKTTAAKK